VRFSRAIRSKYAAFTIEVRGTHDLMMRSRRLKDAVPVDILFENIVIRGGNLQKCVFESADNLKISFKINHIGINDQKVR